MATLPDDITFEIAWQSVMSIECCRRWLLDPTPVPLQSCLQAMLDRPVLSGYTFRPAHVIASDYPVPSIGDMCCLMHIDSSCMFGLNYGMEDVEPIIPTAHHLTKGEQFANPHTTVRRFAIVSHPFRPSDFVRVDCGWLLSGVLTVAYSIYSGESPLKPSCPQVHVRIYTRAAAYNLMKASYSPDASFVNGTTPLLRPAEGFVLLDVYDTRHQNACIFCLDRGHTTCKCPMPFRRRVLGGKLPPRVSSYMTSVSAPEPRDVVMPIRNHSETMSWIRLEKSIKCGSTVGALIATWRIFQPKGDLSYSEHVLSSNIHSYGFCYAGGTHANRRVQRMIANLGLTAGIPQNVVLVGQPHLLPSYHAKPKEAEIGATENSVSAQQRALAVQPTKFAGSGIEIVEMHSLPRRQRVSESTSNRMSMLSSSINVSSRGLQPVMTISKRSRSSGHAMNRSLTAQNASPHCALGSLGAAGDASGNFSQNNSASFGSAKKSSHTQQEVKAVVMPLNMSFTKAPGSADQIITGKLEASNSQHEPLMNHPEAVRTERNPVQAVIVLSSSSEGVSEPKQEDVQFRHGDSSNREPPRPSTAIERAERKAPNLWKCNECGVLIRGKRGNLNRHIANKHDMLRAFECPVPNCGKRFQTRLNLVRHRSTVHEGRPHRCPNCPRAFKTSPELSMHTRTAHGKDGKTMACPVCGRCFGRRSTLNRHTTKVHSIPNNPTSTTGSSPRTASATGPATATGNVEGAEPETGDNTSTGT